MHDREVFADEIFGFLAQQAVQKLLKAWLCVLGKRFPFTHDLVELANLLKECGENVDEFGDVDELNPFAVEHRYASRSEDDLPLDRPMITNMIERLCRHVEVAE